MTLRSGSPVWYLNVLSVSPYKTLTFAMGTVHSYIASLPCQAWQVLNIAGWHSVIILGREIQNNTMLYVSMSGVMEQLVLEKPRTIATVHQHLVSPCLHAYWHAVKSSDLGLDALWFNIVFLTSSSSFI